ncbi:unnamed protein product, partial [Iphiclides podalirius]
MMANLSDVESIQKKLEGCWTQKMADFEKRLKAASTPSNPTLVQLQEDFSAFKELVGSMLNLLQQQVNECYKTVDTLDMQHRRKVILFNGISEAPEVNVVEEILGIIHNKFALTHVSDASFKRCHRIGVQQSDRISPVLVQFVDHTLKSQIWNSKSKLKGSVVSMSEFLTKARQLIHKRARKHFGFRNVWTLDGVINIKLPSQARVKITTEEELVSLIAKFPMDSPSYSGAPSAHIKAASHGVKTMQTQETSPSLQSMVGRRKQVVVVAGSDEAKKTRRFINKK